MNRWRLFGIAFLIVGAVLVIANFKTSGSAQEATPSLIELTCSVPPRDAAFFEAIQGTPVAPDANRGPLIEAYLSSRQAATAEQVAALQESVDQVIACANAGDFARVSALFTDGYWQREVGDLPARADGFASMVEDGPVPILDEDSAAAATVIDARVLPDGRLVALVQYETTDPTNRGIDLTTFMKVGDRWLVDEVATDVGGDLATPTSDEEERERY